MMKQHNRVWESYNSHFRVKRNSPEGAPAFLKTYAAPVEARVMGVIASVQANAPTVKHVKSGTRTVKRIVCR